jgi:hypothetical protein
VTSSSGGIAPPVVAELAVPPTPVTVGADDSEPPHPDTASTDAPRAIHAEREDSRIVSSGESTDSPRFSPPWPAPPVRIAAIPANRLAAAALAELRSRHGMPTARQWPPHARSSSGRFPRAVAGRGVTESPGVGFAPAVVLLVYSAGVVCGSQGSIAGASPKVCWRVGRYLGWRIRLSAGCEETAVA